MAFKSHSIKAVIETTLKTLEKLLEIQHFFFIFFYDLLTINTFLF